MKSNFKITNYKKIGIINTAFIGDIVISFFLAQKIKDIHPISEVILITAPKVRDLLPLIKSIDSAIFYDKRGSDKGIKGFQRVISNLKNMGIDLVLSPHRSLRSTLISFFTNPRLSVSYNTSALSFFYKIRIPYSFKSHEIERNLSLISFFQEYQDNHLPKLKIEFPTHLVENIKTKLSPNLLDSNIITIAPGSIWKTKQWKQEYYTLVAQELISRNYKVVLIGSHEDFDVCKNIAEKTGATNLAAQTNLAESLFIIQNSQLLITNDSSPTHLATIVDCPTITIYGPTIPEFGFYPRAPKSKVIQVENLNCRPCSIHGYNLCPLKHHKCMDEILPEMIIKIANEMLI